MNTSNTKAQQILLREHYQTLTSGHGVPHELSDFGFRNHSQHDEDGILLYLFSLIGEQSRIYVELGCGDGIECNTANLSIHHNWCGLLVDGSENNIKTATSFYNEHPDTRYFPPRCVNAFIDPPTINSFVEKQGFRGEIDLLSIDIDGIDWWLWESLTCLEPRVVVVETPTIWGPQESFTIPLIPDFVASDGNYYGASLLAYSRLASRKGYRLVGCNKYGTNTFFVRNDIKHELLPEVAPETCFTSLRARRDMHTRRPKAGAFEWVSVNPQGYAGT